MLSEIALECLDAAASAIDQALIAASAQGVEPVVALLTRMSKELRAHRGVWWDLGETDADVSDEDEEVDDITPTQGFARLGERAPLSAACGRQTDMNADVSIGQVPKGTRWSFEGAGMRFRVCAFAVLSEGGRERVPVTLLWNEDGGASGRHHCADLRDAFGRAAQMMASAALWSQVEE